VTIWKQFGAANGARMGQEQTAQSYSAAWVFDCATSGGFSFSYMGAALCRQRLKQHKIDEKWKKNHTKPQGRHKLRITI